MARTHTLGPLPEMLSFMNPEATGHALAQDRMWQVARHFIDAEAAVEIVDHEASPFDIQPLVEGPTLVYSDGGDGTVRRVIAAMAGIVPDNPERTANNFRAHQEIVPYLRYFAGAGGNANNWPLSAHGIFALRPEGLGGAQVSVGYHRPLMYEITDEHGDIIRSNIATSGIGAGVAAVAAYRLEKAKSEFEEHSNTRRLLGETAIVLDAARHTNPFSFELSFTSDRYGDWRYADVAGIELVKSKVYAKKGRTRVNVNDTNIQPIMLHHASNVARETLQLMQMAARMRTGRHALPAQDLQEKELVIRLTGDQPVQFHADGETDVDSIILPGQAMRIRLGRIAIPTLMTYS